MNEKQMRKRINLLIPSKILLFAIVACALCFLFTSRNAQLLKKYKASSESLVVYDFVHGMKDPDHLTYMNPSSGKIIERKNPYSIDTAHRNGLLHSGTWIWISDIDGKLMVLERSSHVVTCPNSYSLLGEHSQPNETSKETMRRAIREELGSEVLKHILTFQHLPGSPVFYFRDYGKENENRVDRQLTYLWWVQMDSVGDQLPLKMDAEVKNHKWITTDTLESWLKEAHGNFESTGKVGIRMCHETILTLWELVLKKVQNISHG
jgi:isopentenyldiphosphate isomerase